MTVPLHPGRKGQQGFLLLEVILALAVFSAAATGFAVALHQMAKAAGLAQSELRITRILDSALEETVSLPALEEGSTSAQVGKSDIEMTTTIKLIEGLENEDGVALAEMYVITVSARWYEFGEWKERAAETWRYSRMYQP